MQKRRLAPHIKGVYRGEFHSCQQAQTGSSLEPLTGALVYALV